MPQYQSFPGASGDSRSLEKLVALQIPSLHGKSFLDVGCNEGYFCGYAHFAGAVRVVGVDINPEFICRARSRFPACEFLIRSWDALPNEKFDVILLASALHYANNQVDLIQRLVAHLSPDGVLILEAGVHPDQGNCWVSVNRGIDTREFATWKKIEEVLSSYAYRDIGSSTPQIGDPIPRRVFHISRRKRLAFLLLGEGGKGKTSIARQLCSENGIFLIRGDHLLGDVAAEARYVGSRLAQFIVGNFDHRNIHEAVSRIFQSGLAAEMVELWLSCAKDGSDIAIDAFVPSGEIEKVRYLIQESGFEPVLMNWASLGGSMLPNPNAVERMAVEYEAFLDQECNKNSSTPNTPEILGFVDVVRIEDDLLVIGGWCFNPEGECVNCLRVVVDEVLDKVADFKIIVREDVRKHFNLKDANVGFEIRMPFTINGPISFDSSRVAVFAARSVNDRQIKLPRTGFN